MSALALANQLGSRPVYTTRMPTGHLSPPKISMDLSEHLSEIILAHVTHLVSHTNHLGHKCPQFFQRAISGLSSCSRSVGSVSQAVWRLVQMCLRLFKTVWNGSPLKNSPRTVHQATECQKVLASNRRITYAYQCLASSMPFAMLFVMHFAWHSTDERADTHRSKPTVHQAKNQTFLHFNRWLECSDLVRLTTSAAADLNTVLDQHCVGSALLDRLCGINTVFAMKSVGYLQFN